MASLIGEQTTDNIKIDEAVDLINNRKIKMVKKSKKNK